MIRAWTTKSLQWLVSIEHFIHSWITVCTRYLFRNVTRMETTDYVSAIQHANHITWLVEHHLIALTKPYSAMKKREKVFAQVGVNQIHGFDSSVRCWFSRKVPLRKSMYICRLMQDFSFWACNFFLNFLLAVGIDAMSSPCTRIDSSSPSPVLV